MKMLNKNKKFYLETLKEFNYTELVPSSIIGDNEYNENFFNKINIIENKVLDGVEFEDVLQDYNLSVNKTGLLNKEGNSKIDKKLASIDSVPIYLSIPLLFFLNM